MSDESKEFKIIVQTAYEGVAVEEAIGKQRELGEETQRAAGVAAGGGGGAVRQVDFEAIRAQQAESAKFMAATNAEEIADIGKKAIAEEQQLVVATRRAMLEAGIAGDKTELAKLQAELAVRNLTIQTLRTQAMTQVELNALMAQQNALIEAGAAAAVAEAAAKEASLAEKAVEAGRDFIDFKKIREGAHAFHGLEVAMEGGRMSTRTLTMSLQGLYELLIANPVIAVATAIGAVVVAMGLWAKGSAEVREKIIEDIKEISKKNAELAGELEKKAMESNFDSLKESLAGVKTAYDQATRATREYYATEREKGDIETATKRHENEEKERQELAEAHGDPVKEATIKQHWGEEQLKNQQDNEARKAQLAVDEASKNAGNATKAVDENEAEKAKAEHSAHAATAAFEETQTRVAEAAKKVGVKSEQQAELDRLAELRGMSEARRGKTGNEEMYKLELSEKETKRKATESPTYRTEKTWGDSVTGDEAPDEQITRLAAQKKEFEANINRAKGWGDKDNQSMWESELSKATAAETLRKELPILV